MKHYGPSKDIACLVIDLGSVKCAIGIIISAFHQFCYAHGLQLAVLEVLYKKENSPSPVTIHIVVIIQSNDSEVDEPDEICNTAESANGDDKIEIEHEKGLIVSQNSQDRHLETEIVNSLKELLTK